MAHWRDGGIGNMAGSDDRPIEEWTLLEKLAALAEGKSPSFLSGGSDDYSEELTALAQEAFDFIETITSTVRRLSLPHD